MDAFFFIFFLKKGGSVSGSHFVRCTIHSTNTEMEVCYRTSSLLPYPQQFAFGQRFPRMTGIRLQRYIPLHTYINANNIV